MGIRCLLYVSESCLSWPEDAHQVDEIVTVSRGRNEQLSLTGALIYTRTHFAQVLEGEFWFVIDGQPEKVSKAGEWLEIRDAAIHNEGAQGSGPAKLIAIYTVVDALGARGTHQHREQPAVQVVHVVLGHGVFLPFQHSHRQPRASRCPTRTRCRS